MTNFSTLVNIEKYLFNIDYKSSLMFFGSCFSENIGNKFYELCFRVDINPFGIIYNPISVFENLDILIEKRNFNEDDLLCFNDLWLSFSHHGKFSNFDKNNCLADINFNIEKSSEFLKSSDCLIITLGTSWIYKFLNTNKIVANCHKIPGKEFQKEILSVENIFEKFKDVFVKIKKNNPKIKIIFTISPVRHWKDGAIENQLSKSILFVAINRIINEFEDIFYFPSYEIQMDELRDYRFYADDMLHPSQVAVNYIFERFTSAFFDEETTKIKSNIEKIIKSKNHRPFNPDSENYKKHLKAIEDKIKLLENTYQFLNLDKIKTIDF